MADLIPVFVRTIDQTPDEGSFLTKADPNDLERIVASFERFGVSGNADLDDYQPGHRYFVYGGKTGFEIIVDGTD